MPNSIEQLLAPLLGGVSMSPSSQQPIDPRLFQMWKNHFAPYDSEQDYDLQSAYRNNAMPDPRTGTWADSYRRSTSNSSQAMMTALQQLMGDM